MIMSAEPSTATLVAPQVLLSNHLKALFNGTIHGGSLHSTFKPARRVV
jgi:hypothetical protein